MAEEVLNLREAAEAHRELMAMVASESPADAQELMAEAHNDPRYNQARAAHDTLSKLRDGIALLLERMPAEETPNPNFWDEMLSELDPVDETVSENQRETITTAHDVLRQFSKKLNGTAKLKERKQAQQIRRKYKEALPPEWTADYFIDNPDQLNTVLEAWTADDTASPRAKRLALEQLTTGIAERVRRQAVTLEPETLANFLVITEKAGIAQDVLSNTLLKPYFDSVMGNEIEDVADNYYKFVRAIVTLQDDPSALAFGLRIASFETANLPAQSHYHKILTGFEWRCDLPDVQHRVLTARQVVLELGFKYLDRFPDRGQLADLDLSTSWASGLDLKDPDLEQKVIGMFSRQDFRQSLTDDDRLAIRQFNLAKNAIGQDELLARVQVMQELSRHFHDPAIKQAGIIEQVVNEQNFNGYLTFVVDLIKQEYPDHAEYLDSLVNAPDPLNLEYRATFPAIASNPNYIKSSIQHDPDAAALLVEAISDYLDVDDAVGFGTDTLIDFATEIYAEEMGKQRVRLGDGNVLEFVGELETDDLETILNLFDPEELATAKARVNNSTGFIRPYVPLTAQGEEGMITAILRKETAADQNQIHSLSDFSDMKIPTEEVMHEATLEVLDYVLSGMHHDINKFRRRFMNERGIAVEWRDNTGDQLKLSFRKHPHDPQVFVCQLSGADQKSTFLLDRDFRIQLGSKRVESRTFLKQLNVFAVAVLSEYFCQEAVASEEGTIKDGSGGITERIAHLRLLPEGQKYSYEAWSNCLEKEGHDLEVLSLQQSVEKQTDRKSTYVKAVENDDPEKGPLVIYTSLTHQPVALST